MEEILAQPSLGVSQLQVLVRWMHIFKLSFICSSRKWLSKKSRILGSAWAKPRPSTYKRAWFRFFSKTTASPIVSKVPPHSSRDSFYTSC